MHSTPCIYLLSFVLSWKIIFFTTNNEIHQYGTRQTQNFHFPPVNLKTCQPAVYCMGIKTYNSLRPYIKAEFNNIKKKLNISWRSFYGKIYFTLSMNFSILNKGQLPITYLYLCTLCVFINHASYYNLVYIKQFFTTLIKLYSLQTHTTTFILFLHIILFIIFNHIAWNLIYILTISISMC